MPAFKVGQKRVRVRRRDALDLVTPRAAAPSMDDLKQYVKPFSTSTVEWRTAMEEARAFREALLRENGGKLFSDSAIDINEAREERTAEL